MLDSVHAEEAVEPVGCIALGVAAQVPVRACVVLWGSERPAILESGQSVPASRYTVTIVCRPS